MLGVTKNLCRSSSKGERREIFFYTVNCVKEGKALLLLSSFFKGENKSAKLEVANCSGDTTAGAAVGSSARCCSPCTGSSPAHGPAGLWTPRGKHPNASEVLPHAVPACAEVSCKGTLSSRGAAHRHLGGAQTHPTCSLAAGRYELISAIHQTRIPSLPSSKAPEGARGVLS